MCLCVCLCMRECGVCVGESVREYVCERESV